MLRSLKARQCLSTASSRRPPENDRIPTQTAFNRRRFTHHTKWSKQKDLGVNEDTWEESASQTTTPRQLRDLNVALFNGHCRDLARHLASGGNFPSLLYSKFLGQWKIPADTFRAWVEVIASDDLIWSLQRMGLLDSIGSEREIVDCPFWLFGSMPEKAKWGHDAQYLAGSLLSEHFRSLSGLEQGVYVAKVMSGMLRTANYVALRETVDWLCLHGKNIDHPTAFVFCFDALCTAPAGNDGSGFSAPRKLLQSLTKQLRAEMKTRKVPFTVSTYARLFRPLLIPENPIEAGALLEELLSKDIRPTASMLTALMKVYAAGGQEDGATALFDYMIANKMFLDRRGTPGEKYDSLEPSWIENQTVLLYDSLSKPSNNSLLTDRAAEISQKVEQHLPESPTMNNLFLRNLGNNPDISSMHLQQHANRLLVSSEATFQAQPNQMVIFYTTLMTGFIKKKDANAAIDAWEQALKAGCIPDTVMLGSLVNAYCILSDVEQARNVLEFYAWRPSDVQENLETGIEGGSDEIQKRSRSVVCDNYPVNHLLTAYRRKKDFASVWDIWKNLKSKYGVDPNPATLSAFVTSANQASSLARSAYRPAMQALAIQREEEKKFTSDDWDGRPAWKVAEKVIWEVLEHNWPRAASHIHKNLHFNDGLASVMLRKALAFTIRRVSGHNDSVEDDFPFPATLGLERAIYPQIFPDDKLFRSFVQLMGTHSTAGSVTRLLLWMRYLDCTPSRRTLALAIMFIEESILTHEGTERLQDWLVDWVGMEHIPSPREIGQERNIYHYRKQST